MKTEAEKLQALIELAWENGWEKLKDWKTEDCYCEDCNKQSPYEFTEFGVYENKPFWDEETRVCQTERILFDHAFIKALCKAKYGEEKDQDMWQVEFAMGFDETRHIIPWSTYHLMKLTECSTRINYLYETFVCEESAADKKD